MKSISITLLLGLLSFSSVTLAFTPQQTQYAPPTDNNYLQVGGVEFYIRLPLDKLEHAISFDNTVYFGKGRHIQTKLVGEDDLLMDKDSSVKPIDFVKFLFDLDTSKPNSIEDNQFYKQAESVKAALLKDIKTPLYGYQESSDRLVTFLFDHSTGIAFVVRKNNPDFFLQINTEGLTRTEFVNLVVKGALR